MREVKVFAQCATGILPADGSVGFYRQDGGSTLALQQTRDRLGRARRGTFLAEGLGDLV